MAFGASEAAAPERRSRQQIEDELRETVAVATAALRAAADAVAKAAAAERLRAAIQKLTAFTLGSARST